LILAPGTTQEWLDRRERSNVATIKLIVWIALRLGRPVARLLLHPICVYFVLFSRKPRRSSGAYLRKVLGRSIGFIDLFRHYHAFASCLLDRVFLLNDQQALFDIRIHGEALAANFLASGEGCLMFGAHLGSFEVIRALGHAQPGLRVDLAMFEDNARKISSVLGAINASRTVEVIGLGRLGSMLRVEECLERGDFVGLLTDRTIDGKSHGDIRYPFLGEPAAFATGPFRMAALLKRPVMLGVGLYRGGNRYEVHFELLADFSAVARDDREAAIEQAIRHYAERIEHHTRSAPYNWFNFFDFWH